MKNIAVLLSGCGVFDGAEIHESVLTMLAVTKQGATYQCFAPDIPQPSVVNHLTAQEETNASRNVLVESARIARGNIKPTTELDITAFDGLIIPGGFGAAKNLSNFATQGANLAVNPLVKDFVEQFVIAKKPVGFICIAPVMIPKIYGEAVKCTIGNDAETIAAITKMGGLHQQASVDDIVIDETHKVVSTPAYMLAQNINEANSGIEKLVNAVLHYFH